MWFKNKLNACWHGQLVYPRFFWEHGLEADQKHGKQFHWNLANKPLPEKANASRRHNPEQLLLVFCTEIMPSDLKLQGWLWREKTMQDGERLRGQCCLTDAQPLKASAELQATVQLCHAAISQVIPTDWKLLQAAKAGQHIGESRRTSGGQAFVSKPQLLQLPAPFEMLRELLQAVICNSVALQVNDFQCAGVVSEDTTHGQHVLRW